ncbi:MAG TPA: histidine kinase dimerization/phosphoacceptor domain -containing protein [Spirochaetota bacterium]|nr:histidine kinase dimerization/phosphoacceptor domain -containing protein [Spirochaetota bacterium]
MIIIDLIYNLALLAALSVISGFVGERWKNNWIGPVLQGFLFGSIAVIGMLRPLDMGSGLIFDGRSVVISLCGLFFGPVSVAITVVMTVICRIYQGGIGSVMGVLVILSSSALGLLFYYRYTRRNVEVSAFNLLYFGILVHIVMILMTLSLPEGVAFAVFKEIVLPVMTVYPLATVLIGKIISDNISRGRYIKALQNNEAALRASEGELRTLLQSIPDLIWLKDKDGIYMSCNKMFENFFGADEADIVGKTDYDFLSRELGDFFREKDFKAIEAGKPTINEEWITFANSGCRVLLETIKTPMFDDNGTLIGVLGIGRDITERRQTEDKVKNLLMEKELLLREVHHRIKNNMNTIKGLLTLQLSAEENPSVAASLRDAESRVQSMIMLYDRLYSTENCRELSVKDYLQSLTTEIIGSFPNMDIVKIVTEIDDFVLNVNVLTPLGIIVNELLTNMMKYAFTGRESGILNISAVMKDSKVRVVVQDNGIGIPDSVSFEKSTGFGLNLVSMLTEQIGGSIRIERAGGTKFILEFGV